MICAVAFVSAGEGETRAHNARIAREGISTAPGRVTWIVDPGEAFT